MKAIIIFLLLFTYETSATDVPGTFGTVLFSHHDLKKPLWRPNEMALLYSRWYFQNMTQPPAESEQIDDYYVQKHLLYFQGAYRTINLRAQSPLIDRIMTLALTDSLGAYLKARALPAVKYAYYSGLTTYDATATLFDFYDDIKHYLQTDGNGWHAPETQYLVEVYRNVSSKSNEEEGVEDYLEIFDDPCSKLAYYVILPNGSLIVPTPLIKWETKPVSLILPLANHTLHSLQSRGTAETIKMCNALIMMCLKDDKFAKVDFQKRFQNWLAEEVGPHLYDDTLYPGLGNILVLNNTLCEAAVGADDDDYNIQSSLGTIFGVIVAVELLWCAPAMLCMWCCRRQRKPPCTKVSWCEIADHGRGGSPGTQRRIPLCRKSVQKPLLQRPVPCNPSPEKCPPREQEDKSPPSSSPPKMEHPTSTSSSLCSSSSCRVEIEPRSPCKKSPSCSEKHEKPMSKKENPPPCETYKRISYKCQDSPPGSANFERYPPYSPKYENEYTRFVQTPPCSPKTDKGSLFNFKPCLCPPQPKTQEDKPAPKPVEQEDKLAPKPALKTPLKLETKPKPESPKSKSPSPKRRPSSTHRPKQRREPSQRLTSWLTPPPIPEPPQKRKPKSKTLSKPKPSPRSRTSPRSQSSPRPNRSPSPRTRKSKGTLFQLKSSPKKSGYSKVRIVGSMSTCKHSDVKPNRDAERVSKSFQRTTSTKSKKSNNQCHTCAIAVGESYNTCLHCSTQAGPKKVEHLSRGTEADKCRWIDVRKDKNTKRSSKHANSDVKECWTMFKKTKEHEIDVLYRSSDCVKQHDSMINSMLCDLDLRPSTHSKSSDSEPVPMFTSSKHIITPPVRDPVTSKTELSKTSSDDIMEPTPKDCAEIFKSFFENDSVTIKTLKAFNEMRRISKSEMMKSSQEIASVSLTDKTLSENSIMTLLDSTIKEMSENVSQFENLDLVEAPIAAEKHHVVTTFFENINERAKLPPKGNVIYKTSSVSQNTFATAKTDFVSPDLTSITSLKKLQLVKAEQNKTTVESFDVKQNANSDEVKDLTSSSYLNPLFQIELDIPSNTNVYVEVQDDNTLKPSKIPKRKPLHEAPDEIAKNSKTGHLSRKSFVSKASSSYYKHPSHIPVPITKDDSSMASKMGQTDTLNATI